MQNTVLQCTFFKHWNLNRISQLIHMYMFYTEHLRKRDHDIGNDSNHSSYYRQLYIDYYSDR